MKNSNEKEIKISNQQLINFLSKELNCQHKKREEKIAEIFAFCLDYLNQFEKEDWKRKKETMFYYSLPWQKPSEKTLKSRCLKVISTGKS